MSRKLSETVQNTTIQEYFSQYFHIHCRLLNQTGVRLYAISDIRNDDVKLAIWKDSLHAHTKNRNIRRHENAIEHSSRLNGNLT